MTSDLTLNDEGDMNVVSAETPDWSREHKSIFEWAPSRALIASIRSVPALCKLARLVGSLVAQGRAFCATVGGAQSPVPISL